MLLLTSQNSCFINERVVHFTTATTVYCEEVKKSHLKEGIMIRYYGPNSYKDFYRIVKNLDVIP